MSNFTTRTIKEIFDDFIAKYQILRRKYNDENPLLDKSLVKSIAYALSGQIGVLWKQSLWIYKQCFPQTAELPALKLWGNLVGVDYFEGSPSTLTIQLDDVFADYLPSGTVYKDLTTGLIFKTISQTTNNNGSITTTVVCSSKGQIGNLPAGTTLNIANPMNGIPSTSTVVNVKIEGSADEDVEVYRKRVLLKYRSRSQGGSALDYYNWVMEVPGVADVFPYTLEEGLVTLYIVSTGSGRNRTPSGEIRPNPFPLWIDGQFTEYEGSGVFYSVAKSIEGSGEDKHDRRPMCAKVQLLPPNYTPYSVNITGLTDISHNEIIKNTLIKAFDSKRPHLIVLGYKASDAKINRLALSAEVSEVIGDDTFVDFTLTNGSGEQINEETLGIGCVAYMSELIINGTRVNL